MLYKTLGVSLHIDIGQHFGLLLTLLLIVFHSVLKPYIIYVIVCKDQIDTYRLRSARVQNIYLATLKLEIN